MEHPGLKVNLGPECECKDVGEPLVHSQFYETPAFMSQDLCILHFSTGLKMMTLDLEIKMGVETGLQLEMGRRLTLGKGWH